MREEMDRKSFHTAIDTALSGLQENPYLYQRVIAQENGKEEIIVKKRLSVGLVLAIVLMLITVTAVAAVLLTRQEIVEQVAVPLAVENDTGVGVQGSFTNDQLAKLIRTLHENGFTMEENSRIMQAMQNGQGYYEEETIMEICRQAFGGNFYTWTLEEQDWYNHLMVDIGWFEEYESCLPGPENMTYEEAEAFAFASLTAKYGKDLDPTNRESYALSRQFVRDIENGGAETWVFSLDPKNIFLGYYTVTFEDQNPKDSLYIWGNIPDWSQPYTGDQLLSKFQSVYGWSQGSWPNEAWTLLHEMMQNAVLDETGRDYAACKGYALTEYPARMATEIRREEAVAAAKAAQGDSRAALDSAVLTAYEGKRQWLIGLIVYQPVDGTKENAAGKYVAAIDSTNGNVISLRKQTADDDASMAFVPEAAYRKAREGILQASDYFRIAAEAVQKKYPGLDLLNEDAYEARDWGGGKNHNIHFISRNIRTGNASATVAADGTVSDIIADIEELNGDNLFNRYKAVYGYFGQWDQSTWVQLSRDMDTLEPTTTDGKLLKMGHYPDESSVSIRHEKAQALAIAASGKRTAEVNTCVLIGADPHPVWKIRLLTDDPASPVIELDAETGDVVATDIFKTDYTPSYVLYSTEKNWRKMELEADGPVQMAVKAVTYAYGDLWADFPELEVLNPDYYETKQEGLSVRFLGRWKGMKSYEVQLDENGYIIHCAEYAAESQEERPSILSGNTENITNDLYSLYLPPSDAPAPRADGKPWIYGMDFAPAEYWEQLDETMRQLGVNALNLEEKEREWRDQYGNYEFWPQKLKMCAFMLATTPEDVIAQGETFTYPIFPDPEKKPEEEIVGIATAALHADADESMGAEWADSLSVSIILNSDSFLMDRIEYAGMPCWQVEFEAFEEEYQAWNTKYYIIVSEDGDVLFSELSLNGNG